MTKGEGIAFIVDYKSISLMFLERIFTFLRIILLLLLVCFLSFFLCFVLVV